MKKWTIGLCFCALLAAAFCTASCEKYALPKLEIDNDTIQAPIAGGTFDVKLTSNVRWILITTMTLSHKLVVEQEGVEVTPEPENPENQDES